MLNASERLSSTSVSVAIRAHGPQAGMKLSVERLSRVSQVLGTIPSPAETRSEASLRPQSLARDWQLSGAPCQSSVGAGELLGIGTHPVWPAKWAHCSGVAWEDKFAPCC